MPGDKTKQDPTLVGELIAGRYFVARLLGRGGMGEVYEAEDRNVLNQSVAIKALSNVHATNHLLRFTEEARSQAALGNHPNICAVKDLVMGEDGKLKYIVQEYIEGETLDVYLTRNNERLFSSEIQDTLLEISIQMCETMAFAHTAPIKGREKLGVIHRDIKPDNVMLRVIGGKIVVVIVDFGISRVGEGAEATSAGDVFGTPLYASPQQLIGDSVDHRTDIFSMGLILYEILVGPFYPINVTIAGVVVDYMNNYKERLENIVDHDAREIVRKCIEHNPDDRWQTMGELAEALREYHERRKKSRSDQTAEMQQIDAAALAAESADESFSLSNISPVAPVRPPPRENAPKLIKIATQASSTTSRVFMIGGVLLGLVLIGIMIYSFTRTSKDLVDTPKKSKIAAKKQRFKSMVEVDKPMVRSIKKRPRPSMKQVKPRKAPRARLVVPKDPVLVNDGEARKMFKNWSDWCQKHHKLRGSFKTTPALHSHCIRSHAEKFFKNNRQYIDVGLIVQKLLRKKFCTWQNRRCFQKDKNKCSRKKE